MRQLALASTFAVACGFAVWTAPSAHAALLTFGPQGQPYGGYGCADVAGANLAPFTPLQAFDCHGAGNQQFDFNGVTIHDLALQRCMDARLNGKVPGTLINSYPCNGTQAQAWYYYFGTIRNVYSNLCVDATTGANGKQLILNTCNGSQNQQWQLK
jgi:hypothetical protein